MAQADAENLINRLTDCVGKLLDILDKIGRLAQAGIEMYEGGNFQTKQEETEMKEEEVQPPQTLDLMKETEEMANKLKTFGNNLTNVIRELPNDEPVKPNANEFDAFLLEYTEKLILKKIKDIGDVITSKRPQLTSRRSY